MHALRDVPFCWGFHRLDSLQDGCRAWIHQALSRVSGRARPMDAKGVPLSETDDGG